MTNQKTNWKYILLVVILAVVVSGGILWREKTQEVPFTQLPEITKPEKPAQDETTDWNTYRNEEYGFEVKYPEWVERFEDWRVIGKSSLKLIGFLIPCYGLFPEEECFQTKVIRGTNMCKMGEKMLEIEVIENPSQLPITEWVQQNVIERTEVFGGEEYRIYRGVGPLEEVILDGIKGIRTNFQFEFQAGSCEMIYLPKNLKVYAVGVCIYEAYRGPCSLWYPNPDEMLSTFRFVEIKTEVIQYIPTQLPSEIKEGYCWINSLSAQRKDAWRCMTDSMISDPCFTIQGSENLVCNPNPITNGKGFLLKLTKPLPEATATDNFGKGWGWLIELEDGTACHFLTGATATVNAKRINYNCDVLGDLEVGTVWKAEKAELELVDNEWQAKSIEWVPIRRVWQ